MYCSIHHHYHKKDKFCLDCRAEEIWPRFEDANYNNESHRSFQGFYNDHFNTSLVSIAEYNQIVKAEQKQGKKRISFLHDFNY